jgi:ubiquinone biosynthesis protein
MLLLKNADLLLANLARTAWALRGLADELAERVNLGGDEARRWGRRSRRLSSVAGMLTRVLGDYRLFAIYSAFLSRRAAAARLERLHARNARRFHQVSVTEGGAFLKVGQLLSARRDLLPAVWTGTLATLQDSAPAESFADVRATVEAELEAPLASRFRSFDETPVGAASIGQVHRAVTLDGQAVAVKVQRPGIAERVEDDLTLLGLALEGLRGMLPPTDLDTITAELRERVMGELDYVAEARAMQRMADAFDGTEGVRVPRPVPELCSARLLTATFVPGQKITCALDAATADGAGGDGAGATEQVSELLGRLLEVHLRQVLELGFFQADPHPGNFLVTAQGELVLLDFGCTREIDDATRRAYKELMMCSLAGDVPGVVARLESLGFRTASGRPDTLLAFAAELLAAFRSAALGGTVHWPTTEELLAQSGALLEQMQRDPVVRIPSEFVMIGRLFATLGGLMQHHRPRLDWSRLSRHLM